MLAMNLTGPNPDVLGYLNSQVGNKYPVMDDQVLGAKLNAIYLTNTWLALLDPVSHSFPVSSKSMSYFV